jgi:hypothetical protein
MIGTENGGRSWVVPSGPRGFVKRVFSNAPSMTDFEEGWEEEEQKQGRQRVHDDQPQAFTKLGLS